MNSNDRYQSAVKFHYKDYLNEVKSQADLKRAQRQREAAQEAKEELQRRESLQQQYEQLKKSQVAKESLLRENLEQIRKDSIQARKERQERKIRDDSKDREIEQLHNDAIEAKKLEASMKKKVITIAKSDIGGPNERRAQDSDANRPGEESPQENHRQTLILCLCSAVCCRIWIFVTALIKLVN